MSTLIKKINQLLVWSKSFTQASTAVVVLIKRKQKYIVEEQENTKLFI